MATAPSQSPSSFAARLAREGLVLDRRPVTTLQVNVGKRCNQACAHCHVAAGPRRTEEMDRRTFARLLALLEDDDTVHTVDLTGGAPELNPHFRWFVSEVRALGRGVIDRCNLTVLSEPGQEDTAAFLAGHDVRVVASLPCYTADNVEKQRGHGVFGRSIDGLRALNRVGYGRGDGLVLDLVYNPVGPSLPPPQSALEADYRRRLADDFGVAFDRLLTLTNMPVARFADQLRRRGDAGRYAALLQDAFNPDAARAVMCRDLASVSWDGRLYDCDFNQMLGLGPARSVWDVDRLQDLAEDPVTFDDHCFGCTAGAGSSCGGALT